jgi:hypothetical protein
MHDSAAITALAERIATLERQTRRLKRQLFAALVAVLCLGTVSASIAQERTIKFSGPKGTVRIDSLGVHFLNKAGSETALLGYTKKATAPSLYFSDASGKRRMLVGLATTSDGLVRMWGANGNVRVTLQGDALLAFYDPRGTRRLDVGTSTSEQGTMEVYGSNSTPRMWLGETTDNVGNLRIFNPSGKVQTELASEFLRVGDNSGTQRAYVGLVTQGYGSIQIMNSSGTRETELGDQFLRIGDTTGTERGYIGLATDNPNASMLELFDTSHVLRSYVGMYTDGTTGFSAYNSSGTALWSSR